MVAVIIDIPRMDGEPFNLGSELPTSNTSDVEEVNMSYFCLVDLVWRVDDVVKGFFLLLLLVLLFTDVDEPEKCEPETAALDRGFANVIMKSNRALLTVINLLKRLTHFITVDKIGNAVIPKLMENFVLFPDILAVGI